MSIVLILSIAWFAIFIISHVTVFLIFPVNSRAKIIKNSFRISLLGLLSSMLLGSNLDYFINGEVFYIHSLALECMYGLAIMFSLFILYMPFYYTIATSLSVESMIILSSYSKKQQKAELSVLINAFTSKELIKARLDLMATNGYISANPNYQLRTKGLVIAKFFATFKKLWRLGAGG